MYEIIYPFEFCTFNLASLASVHITLILSHCSKIYVSLGHHKPVKFHVGLQMNSNARRLLSWVSDLTIIVLTIEKKQCYFVSKQYVCGSCIPCYNQYSILRDSKSLFLFDTPKVLSNSALSPFLLCLPI